MPNLGKALPNLGTVSIVNDHALVLTGMDGSADFAEAHMTELGFGPAVHLVGLAHQTTGPSVLGTFTLVVTHGDVLVKDGIEGARGAASIRPTSRNGTCSWDHLTREGTILAPSGTDGYRRKREHALSRLSYRQAPIKAVPAGAESNRAPFSHQQVPRALGAQRRNGGHTLVFTGRGHDRPSDPHTWPSAIATSRGGCAVQSGAFETSASHDTFVGTCGGRTTRCVCIRWRPVQGS